MKICFKCKKEKHLDEFYKHKAMADGHLNKCKECTKKDSIKNRSRNINYYKEYEKSRANLPHRLDARKTYSKTDKGLKARSRARDTWLNKNPEKRIAHNILRRAIRARKILKSTKCQLCGASKSRIEGHHYDYNEPLKVTWLCLSCHRLFHKTKSLANAQPPRPPILQPEMR